MFPWIFIFRIFLGEGGLLNTVIYSNLYDNVSFSYFDLYGLSLYSWEGGGSNKYYVTKKLWPHFAEWYGKPLPQEGYTGVKANLGGVGEKLNKFLLLFIFFILFPSKELPLPPPYPEAKPLRPVNRSNFVRRLVSEKTTCTSQC